MINWPLL